MTVLPVGDRTILVGGHEDLAEGKGDALAELVGGIDREFPPSVLAVSEPDAGVEHARGGVAAGAAGISDGKIGTGFDEVERGRERHLLVQPTVIAFIDESVDVVVADAEGGLREKARGVLRGNLGEIDGRSCDGNIKGRRAGSFHETAGEFTGGELGRVDRDRNASRFEGRDQVGGAVSARRGEVPSGVADLALREIVNVVTVDLKMSHNLRRAEVGERDVDVSGFLVRRELDGAGAVGRGAGDRRRRAQVRDKERPRVIEEGAAGAGVAPDAVAVVGEEREGSDTVVEIGAVGLGHEADGGRRGAGGEAGHAAHRHVVDAGLSGTTKRVAHIDSFGEIPDAIEREDHGRSAPGISRRNRSGDAHRRKRFRREIVNFDERNTTGAADAGHLNRVTTRVQIDHERRIAGTFREGKRSCLSEGGGNGSGVGRGAGRPVIVGATGNDDRFVIIDRKNGIGDRTAHTKRRQRRASRTDQQPTRAGAGRDDKARY